ncbi:MAG: glycosyltransferase family 2 protein [Patescibacteria group bacterium]|nr:glycosyltransferase family 2 protein [Patescibacteria group bacterium]
MPNHGKSRLSKARLEAIKLKFRQWRYSQGPPQLPRPGRGCRVAVIIPAYNETPRTLVRPLLSLAVQSGVVFDVFEVLVVVNNSRRQARRRSREFLANQRLLRWLESVAAGSAKDEAGKIIHRSGLVVHALDKSSLERTEADNHVGHARNVGCLEASLRFLSGPWRERGILAFTDADCRLSPNYIREIIATFDQYRCLNGLSGALAHEIDETLPNPALVKKAFDAHVGFSDKFYLARGLALKRRDGLRGPVLLAGANMAVSVSSWLLAGGLPNRPSGEDYYFGRAVEDLPGDVAATDRYTVYPLIRSSERAGLHSYGRRVREITAAVAAFVSGDSSRIYIPHLHRRSGFINRLMRQAEAAPLNQKQILSLMKTYGCEAKALGQKTLDGLAKVYNQQAARPRHLRDYGRLERRLWQALGDRLPVWDATEKIIQSEQA